MSALPRIRQIAPVAPVKKSLVPLAVAPREKKPLHHTRQKDWQDAVRMPRESLREALVLPVVPERRQQDANDSEQEKDKHNPEHEALFNKAGATGAGTSEAVVQAAEEPLPLSMNRLGGLIAAFVVHSVVHGSWAVQIPLSHALLPETVLHMRCEHAILTLRFETSDWRSRETLMRHTPTLLRRLRQSLPQLVEIILLTN